MPKPQRSKTAWQPNTPTQQSCRNPSRPITLFSPLPMYSWGEGQGEGRHFERKKNSPSPYIGRGEKTVTLQTPKPPGKDKSNSDPQTDYQFSPQPARIYIAASKPPDKPPAAANTDVSNRPKRSPPRYAARSSKHYPRDRLFPLRYRGSPAVWKSAHRTTDPVPLWTRSPSARS